MLSFFIGWRYTGARKRSQLVSFISTVSIVGLVTSVSLLVVVLSVMNGFDKEVRERVLGVVEHASIRHRDGVENWPSLRETLLQHPRVLGAAPFVELPGMAYQRGKATQLLLFGLDPQLEPEVSAIQSFVPSGILDLLQQQTNTVLLGKELAAKIGVDAGDKLRILVSSGDVASALSRTRVVSVIGVIDTGTQLDQRLALTSLSTAQALSDRPDKVTGIRIKVEDLFAAPYIAYALVQELPYGYYARDWTRSYGNQYQAIQMSKKLVTLLLLLIIAIAVFNLVSTLVMVVVDKHGDIAILRTLGASTKKIMGIFMVQGSAIGLIGTGVGIGIGVLLALWVEDIVQVIEKAFDIQFLKSDVYPTSFLPSDIQWPDLVLIACVSLSLCFLATLYPAWRASRVNPAEALRFEL